MNNSVSGAKIASSFAWVIFEKLGYSGLRLLSTLILARLLTPHDFGLVGSVAIITDIANMIVESGMGAALINKKEVTDKDFNTVFTFNIIASVLLYLIIFFSAPYVADYFASPILKNVIRILSLSLIFNAITLVQRTVLIRELWYRKQSFISLLSLLLSIILAIMMAVSGMGVWAIVGQLVSYSAIFSIMIVFVIRYVPRLYFSMALFKELLSFGGRIILSAGLQTIYNSIISSVVAKVYSIRTAGLYTQSQKVINFPVNIFRALFDIAAFPILSKVRGHEEFRRRCSQVNRGIFLMAFPLLLIIPFNTRSVILLLLGKQWLEADRILAILSVGIIFYLVSISTFGILKSAGEAKVFLRIGIYKTLIGFGILSITVFFSIKILLYGIILTNLLASLLGIFQVDRLTGYKLKTQLKDIWIPILLALVANGIAYFISGLFYIHHIIWHLLVFVFVMGVIFTLQCILFRVKEIDYVVRNIRKRIK